MRIAAWPWDNYEIFQAVAAAQSRSKVKRLHVEPMRVSHMMDEELVDIISAHFKHLEWLTIDCHAQPYTQLSQVEDNALQFVRYISFFFPLCLRVSMAKQGKDKY